MLKTKQPNNSLNCLKTKQKYNMKKVLLIALLPVLMLGCVKSASTGTCTNATPASEEAQIIAFCNTNGIVYQKDSSGIYYQIIDPGTAPAPNQNSTISVTYVAKYLDGTILDQTTTPIVSPLSSLIEGWRIGIPLIAKGGHIKMVVPSSLCYGCAGIPGSIPGNAILYCDITLVDVQ